MMTSKNKFFDSAQKSKISDIKEILFWLLIFALLAIGIYGLLFK